MGTLISIVSPKRFLILMKSREVVLSLSINGTKKELLPTPFLLL